MDIIKNKIKYSVLVFLILPLYAEIDYNSEIQPIFNSSCINCHSGSDAEEDLSLTSYNNVMNGGDSGDVVIPYEHANSLLWQYINSSYMPPYGSGSGPLTTDQINLIAQWIDEGALPESNESMLGDVNDDGAVNVLDVVLLVNLILSGNYLDDNPGADVNEDEMLNVLDVVSLIGIILNSGDSTIPEECLLEPDSGPCFGYVPMYYYNQDTQSCEMFIYGGCMGLVPFQSLLECQNLCE